VWASGNFSVTSSVTTPNIEKRKNILTTILEYHSSSLLYKSLSIIIDTTLIEPRGRIQWPKISLSSRVLRDGEFIKLFVHEFGHYVDLYFFTPIWWKDLSDSFYGISWSDTTVKRSWEELSSFVSGYAATNKYEDFAESFTFYIFHNTYFADRALKNASLRDKYLFLSKSVFPNGQFVWKDFSTTRIPNYLWDTTKIPISWQKYLYSLN
jgi:hypothetical protein